MENSRSLGAAALLTVAALSLAVGINPLSNNDIWLHLTTGRLIVERGALPRVDEYSFTRAGAPYVAHEWLAQVIFHLIFRAAGVTGLIALKPIALGTTAALVALTCRKVGAGPVATLCASALCVASMASHLYVRPHLFTFVMLAATAHALAAPRGSGGRPLLRLAPLQILWANLHGGFVLGIAMAAATGTWVVAGGLAAISLLNPWGPALYRFVIIFADPVFRRRIREWAGPFQEPFAGSFHFYVYLTILLLAVAAAAHHARRRRYGAVAVIAIFAGLSLASKRNASLLGVAAAPWLALAGSESSTALAALGGRPRGLAPSAALALSCAAILLAAAVAAALGVPHEAGGPRRPGLGIGENVPVAALDHIQSRGIEGNALASFAFGSYVIYRAWPSSKVFIDSRLDVFGGPMVEEFSLAMADPVRMRRLLGRYRLDYAVLSYRLDDVEGPVGAFAQDGGWALIHYDDLAMVYVRREPRWSALIAREEYRHTNPYLFLTSRSSFAADPGAALVETRRALAVSPSSLVARLMKGTALQAAGRHREALADLELAASRLGPGSDGEALVLGLMGTSYAELEDRARARAAFERLLEIAPDSAFARRMLEEIRAKGAERN